MTTANLLNVSSVKTVQVDVSKKLQEEARDPYLLPSHVHNPLP